MEDVNLLGGKAKASSSASVTVGAAAKHRELLQL